MDSDEDFRHQLEQLSARVASLETMIPALEAQLRATHTASQDPPATASVTVPTSAMAMRAAARPSSPKTSLESRIGTQLLNRVGILAVLIGVAWFLKLAFDRNWIGPPVRILVGLAGAAGLMAWSERFRRQGFSAFSYSLKALGTGIAYLSLWAAFSLFHLAPAWLIFLAMTGVTIANAVLARRQNSELLAIYALAGGLATPCLLWMVHSNDVFLFSYLALLNGGALLLLVMHPWQQLAWAALLGTAAYYGILSQFFPAGLPVTLFFLTVYFAAFAITPWFMLRQARPPRADPTFPIAFPIVNAMATFLALLALFGAIDQHPIRPWAAVALAAACLLMASIARQSAALSRTYLGLGIFFITVAVPLAYHGPLVTLCWLGEALTLMAIATARTHPALRAFATPVLIAAALSLLLDWFAGTPQPLAVGANLHFVTNLIGAAVFAAVAKLSLGGSRGWRILAGFAAVAFSVTLLVAVSLEIHHYWFCGAGFWSDFCGGYGQLERRSVEAGWGYSAWWMLYGAILMAVGFWRHSALLRWQALVLLAFTIGKVFLNGVSQQSQGYRVLSFLVLGVLLLAVSFAYQKNWLRLRG